MFLRGFCERICTRLKLGQALIHGCSPVVGCCFCGFRRRLLVGCRSDFPRDFFMLLFERRGPEFNAAQIVAFRFERRFDGSHFCFQCSEMFRRNGVIQDW
jgi:hypothetical protein